MGTVAARLGSVNRGGAWAEPAADADTSLAVGAAWPLPKTARGSDDPPSRGEAWGKPDGQSATIATQMKTRAWGWGPSLLCVASVAWGQAGNPQLSKAEQQIKELRYADALKALDAALAAPGNDRDTLLRLFELQGVAAATLNQGARAQAAFRRLLSLDPERALSRQYAPRVTTPYYEAKAWCADKGALRAEPSPGAEAVTVAVKPDPMNLARAVRFHLHAPSGAWTDLKVGLDKSRSAEAKTAGAREYWAEVLGEADGVLLSLGDQGKPLALPGAATEPVAAKAPDAAKPPEVERRPEVKGVEATPETRPGPAVEGLTRPAPSPLPLRALSYGAFGAAGAAAVVGVIFGLRSGSARSEYEDAERAADGSIVGINQRRAAELDSTARSSATTANSCYVGAAVLAAGGAALFLLGAPATVAPAPGGGALVLAGTLP